MYLNSELLKYIAPKTINAIKKDNIPQTIILIRILSIIICEYINDKAKITDIIIITSRTLHTQYLNNSILLTHIEYLNAI